jgi:hypothetical protein
MSSFAFLLRVPFEGAVIDQVALTQTGTLNIDGSRTAADMSEFFSKTGKPRSGLGHAKAYGMGDGYGGELANPPHPAGRWPSNVALIHGPGCQRIGEARVKGHKGYPNGPGGSSTQFSQKGTATSRREAWAGHADAEGKETIAVWRCQSFCPVAVLDALSGDLPAGVAVRRRSGGNTFGGSTPKPAMADMTYGDSGGASKFYPQFSSPWEFLEWVRTLIRVPGDVLLEEV